jgi:hypothetical protein
VHETLSKDELAEVFVCGHKNGAPRVSLLQDLLIRDAGRQLSHVDDVMTFLTQPLHHWAVNTLIGDQIHADFAPTG